MTESLLVVCPAYNEASAVAAVVAELRQAVPHAEVVVVDDGSTDETATIARASGARVLQLPFNVGVGGALRAGILLGRLERVDVVVQCDADGQHPAAAIPSLVRGLKDADIVIGTRWGAGDGYNPQGPRLWAMWVLARVLSWIHATELSDTTSGFRAFGAKAIDVFSRELPPEYLADTVDALLIAKAHGLRVVEVAVVMRTRDHGFPSQSPLRATLYLARVSLIVLLSLVRMLLGRKSIRGG
jgi:glycosyltransferase involved in cell wall biosynthesis